MHDFVLLMVLTAMLDFSVGIKGCAALEKTLLFGLQYVRSQILSVKHILC